MIRLEHPLLSNEELEKLRQIDRPGFKSATLSAALSGGPGRRGNGTGAGGAFCRGRCGG